MDKLLEGEVVVHEKKIENVHVQNLTSKKGTITDSDGKFQIKVHLNDTLLFTSVQLKRKSLVVTSSIMESSFVSIIMEEYTNELDEVVIRPYNLSGDLNKDLDNLKIGPVVSASTLKLPNANAKRFTQSENKLNDADHGKFYYFYVIALTINTNKILNRLSGRTKMLKKRVALDKKSALTQSVQKSIMDSLFINQLKIPIGRIPDFMYYCEADSVFQPLAIGNNDIKLWDFLMKKSESYRKNNNLD
ncbi:hypothetical protein GGR42_001208 [Saonia flava]|uniref:Carboxypeptidase-like regulatory domain-containing protein n=1 Tax=Saonia flava TaxID=523696 RepID=A0A846QNV5_9FLAO|nr:carboxypeptidase-like regulatory domain-containing protein [Saonia flava]NJB70746.1 hypothetical protein [Saonia flava]